MECQCTDLKPCAKVQQLENALAFTESLLRLAREVGRDKDEIILEIAAALKEARGVTQ